MGVRWRRRRNEGDNNERGERGSEEKQVKHGRKQNAVG